MGDLLTRWCTGFENNPKRQDANDINRSGSVCGGGADRRTGACGAHGTVDLCVLLQIIRKLGVVLVVLCAAMAWRCHCFDFHSFGGKPTRRSKPIRVGVNKYYSC